MDRLLWSKAVRDKRVPDWPCPRCGQGHLTLVKDTMKVREHPSSRAAHSHEDWDPDWIQEVFHCETECTRCGDLAVVVGTASFSNEVFDEETGWSREREFSVHAIVPAPKIIGVPNQVPLSTQKELDRAFALFWNDPPASLNRIRSSLECLCDSEKVAHRGKRKDGSRFLLSLHTRVEQLPPKYDSVRESLLAVKWLGNDGTHGTKATHDDVLDALQLLEFVFDRVFGSEKSIKAMTKLINKRKGSRHRK